jgi:hypothetical protein
MLHMYVPVDKTLANPGTAYEKAVLDAADFLMAKGDSNDPLSQLTYDILLDIVERRLKELRPHMNQWMIARHGISLN